MVSLFSGKTYEKWMIQSGPSSWLPHLKHIWLVLGGELPTNRLGGLVDPGFLNGISGGNVHL